jgi:hypothetical protein
MFHNRWSKAKGELIVTYDDNIDFNEAEIKSYVLKKAENNEPAFASDHQLIIGEFEF